MFADHDTYGVGEADEMRAHGFDLELEDSSGDWALELLRDQYADLQENDSELEIREETLQSPVVGLDDSELSHEIRWVFSNSWKGNTGSEDWTFCPTREDLTRGERCLSGVASELRREALSCVEGGKTSASHHRLLNRFLFVHQVIHGWWLQLSDFCGIDAEALEMWKLVLDAYWRKTPEHHAIEKMARDRPEAKARRKAYDQGHDAVRKNTDSSRARQREVQKAYRARKKLESQHV